MKSFSYIPNTDLDRAQMLEALGMESVQDLFSDIPKEVRMARDYNLPSAASEWELSREFAALAGENRHVEEAISFLGAGAYQHYIPSVVDAVIGRSEFYTSYTPYQPEISQGVLQAIFEYQSLVAELFGLAVSNASLYDGATACGEAALMACAHTRRNKILVSQTVHPEYRQVLATYARGQGVTVQTAPEGADGATDMDALSQAMTGDVAAVLVQYPNFYGIVEDVRVVAEMAHRHGALLIVAAYPLALGILESPGALGADIAVAEGQSLGNPLSYGGPYLGVMAVTKELTRRLPGRIVGQTQDLAGRRGFVLTLQAREQHIRREKASSNICSNQALNALAASVYLTYMGAQGLREVGLQCMAKARYARERFMAAGARPLFDGPYVNEFTLQLPRPADEVVAKMAQKNVFFGYSLARDQARFQGAVLLAVTEIHSKADIDRAAEELEAIL